MCTALCFTAKNNYFGRTLDIDRSYGEEICIMPRNFTLKFREAGEMHEHYAIIGMATVTAGTPLFYDAVNEHGVAMAGLNFPNNAYYHEKNADKDNIAPFEFIPWVLGQCRCLGDVSSLLSRINLVNISFAEALPNSPLHFIISHGGDSLVVESVKEGIFVYENPTGVLTNNPPFPYQMENLKKYEGLRIDNREVKRDDGLPYSSYSQGLGAVGLPGDVSSKSRFVRACFVAENAVRPDDEASSVGQFFHVLSNVEMVKGACKTDEGSFDITSYTSCMNTECGLYYYTSYSNHRISCVNMHACDLNSTEISRFPLVKEEGIYYQNR